MGKKARQKGRKKDRRRGSDLVDATASPAVERAAGRQPDTHRGIADEAWAADAGRAAHGSEAGPPASPTELAARLASLGTVLRRQIARADAGDGLSRARLSALSLLVLGGPRTLGELATAEGVRPPTMTRLVTAMEADGLLERHPNPADGRSIIVAATAAGEAQLDLGRARQLAPLAGSIEALDDDGRRALGEAAELIARLLRGASWTGHPGA
jgi:DNA-binding MarR family transcriptional regulator